MVLFGGNPPGEDSIGTLYILDVPSMTWTQGPSIDPSQNRSQLACTVNGDNFIAWGGKYMHLFAMALRKHVQHTCTHCDFFSRLFCVLCSTGIRFTPGSSGKPTLPMSS